MELFQLDRGILLEDIGILLPWNTPGRKLRKLGRPLVSRSKDRVTLCWNDHLVFGGLRCQVQANFRRAFLTWPGMPVTDSSLAIVYLNFANSININPRSQFDDLKKQLIKTLGMPSFEGNLDPPFNLPSAQWDSDMALIELYVNERFGEYCVGQVWRKPLPPVWRPELIINGA
jgi:hypothetical protein